MRSGALRMAGGDDVSNPCCESGGCLVGRNFSTNLFISLPSHSNREKTRMSFGLSLLLDSHHCICACVPPPISGSLYTFRPLNVPLLVILNACVNSLNQVRGTKEAREGLWSLNGSYTRRRKKVGYRFSTSPSRSWEKVEDGRTHKGGGSSKVEKGFPEDYKKTIKTFVLGKG